MSPRTVVITENPRKGSGATLGAELTVKCNGRGITPWRILAMNDERFVCPFNL